MGDEIALVMDLIARLAIALKAAPMTRWPNAWRHQVDEHWTITLNGQREAIRVPIMGAPFELPPYHCVVEYNGWLAGLIQPYGGELAAGEAANEATLCAALLRALARLEEPE
ncbi:MAG: hypothetical protein HY323_09060 [Betaproteobacteria bacterium]|nr:hypothetical protein [Betaproteobacteria bacterium]